MLGLGTSVYINLWGVSTVYGCVVVFIGSLPVFTISKWRVAFYTWLIHRDSRRVSPQPYTLLPSSVDRQHLGHARKSAANWKWPKLDRRLDIMPHRTYYTLNGYHKPGRPYSNAPRLSPSSLPRAPLNWIIRRSKATHSKCIRVSSDTSVGRVVVSGIHRTNYSKTRRKWDII